MFCWTAFRRVHTAAPLKPSVTTLGFAPLRLTLPPCSHGGPIEAELTVPSMGLVVTSFRRVHTAAPLKRPAFMLFFVQEGKPFRRVHTAAPLKRAYRSCDSPS